MTTLVVRGPAAISGETTVPGDKSISHRALMLGAVADGTTTIRNAGPGEDVASTVRCLEAYGVRIERNGADAVVHGRGLRSWHEPAGALDCGNSGTTMRLLCGLAAHYAFPSVLDGDASLHRRPMDRLVGPLTALGASVKTTDGRPPVTVSGGRLSGAEVETGVPSAQVKTAVIFAGLAADGETKVTEPALSRDHTERILSALGAPLTHERLPDGRHTISASSFAPPAFDIVIPGDISSAAFLIAAAVLGGDVLIQGVGLNPTRSGFLELLSRMGAEVRWSADRERMGEPSGSVRAGRSDLAAVTVEGPTVPTVVDELPLLAVLATQARGTSTVRGAEELRAKESDRIAATISALRLLGADAEEHPDGFTVRGPTPLFGTKVEAADDHRVAMALGVAGLVASGETLVDGFEAAGVSWPGFDKVLAALGADVELR
ncbi:MAG: 3-phosphoshikimate 1-carboxyvinyltransferase [Actinomycetota bacterium]